jgi:hypothetical protein
MFLQRFYDIADYKVGWVFNIPGTNYGSVFTIVRYKISKIMDAPRYITVIGIFGKEFVLS